MAVPTLPPGLIVKSCTLFMSLSLITFSMKQICLIGNDWQMCPNE